MGHHGGPQGCCQGGREAARPRREGGRQQGGGSQGAAEEAAGRAGEQCGRIEGSQHAGDSTAASCTTCGWRNLAMKVRFGLGASAMAVKARNLKDAASFIDK